MGHKIKTLGRAFALFILRGLIIWHVIRWQADGIYLEMFDYLESGNGYLTVLYNLGLMLLTGVILGLLPGTIASLFVRGKSEPHRTDSNTRKEGTPT